MTYTYPIPEEILSITPERERIAGKVCPLCGMAGSVVAKSLSESLCAAPIPDRAIKTHDLRVCSYHNLLLSWVWDSEEEYQRWYMSDQYAENEQIENGQAPMLQRDAEYLEVARTRVDAIQKHGVAGGALLDVGAGTGGLVEVAAQAGFIALGFEPSPALVEFARSNQRRVGRAAWSSVVRSAVSYDVITLFDVLEHLTRPLDCLRSLASRLNHKGLIVVEMPQWDSPDQRKAGLYWRHIRPRQHVCLYSKSAAEELFSRAGLEVEAFSRPLRGALGKACWYLGKRDTYL